jgi:hypothetical protein
MSQTTEYIAYKDERLAKMGLRAPAGAPPSSIDSTLNLGIIRERVKSPFESAD